MMVTMETCKCLYQWDPGALGLALGLVDGALGQVGGALGLK